MQLCYFNTSQPETQDHKELLTASGAMVHVCNHMK